MRTGTVISLGASAVLGVGALIVARVWLPQPNAHGPQQAKPAVEGPTVPVVVAGASIPYGGKVDPSHLIVERLPASDVPPGAFSDPSQLIKQQGGVPIALTPIAAREPVLPGKLSGGGARAIVSAAIADGMRAFTIAVSDTSGVGGHILPGDRVDVIVTRQPPIPKAVRDLCGDCKLERADVVLQNVKVLGMDLNVDPTSTQSAVAHTATLEVSVLDAQRLSVAAQIGIMSLALRRTGQADITPVRTVDVSDVRSNAPHAAGRSYPSDLQLITAGAHPRAPSGPGQITIRTRSVTIVHGENATQVEVPRYGAGA
ncbi:MAG TPA: Flp pilus assembly protein CpaB [Caulobacteraceae bacterium]|jgi:pilus assembly protein CpaB|nr:Flp pilus assembly protein CpaB [Caulobacteraceae bacterium]